MEAAQRHEDVIQVGELEIHPGQGLALAGGTALSLSVREFGLLVALARSGGDIVRREDLYRRVWGGPLRDGDWSIDVYIHSCASSSSRRCPAGGSSTRTSGSATGSPPSVHALFTSRRPAGNSL
jgi:hypothetical protein